MLHSSRGWVTRYSKETRHSRETMNPNSRMTSRLVGSSRYTDRVWRYYRKTTS